MEKSVTVRAPSSTANLGPGFDVFGLALDAFYDQVKITKKGKGIKIITSDSIPTNPQKNTAGLVATSMLKKFKIKGGIEIVIKKGVPAGYGMGSSAASAAATAAPDLPDPAEAAQASVAAAPRSVAGPDPAGPSAPLRRSP